MGYSANEDVYAPCACGSGKKYKFCCLAEHREERRKAKPRALPRALERDPLASFAAAMEAHEDGSALLEKGRFAEALEEFQRSVEAFPFAPQPHNNIALIQFHLGNVDRAVELCEKVIRSLEPGNAFALGSLVHYYLILGRDEEARAALEDLLRASPQDEFAMLKKCEALARFGRHEEILAVAHEAISLGESKFDFAFFAGTALANLARYEEAEDRLRGVLSSSRRGERAGRYIDLLRKGEAPDTLDGSWSYLEPEEWAPAEIRSLLETTRDRKRCPGLADGLLVIMEKLPEGAEEVLELLRWLDTPRSRDILWKVATGTFGSDAMRVLAAQHLSVLGAIPRGEPLRLWLEGEWTVVTPNCTEVTPEAVSALPEELRPRMNEVCLALRVGDWARAERTARDMLPVTPASPSVYQNLAMAVYAQGRAREAEDLLLRAMEIDPTYLFAPASLADWRVAEGRVKEAREILNRVSIPTRTHPDAQLRFMEAQARVALAEENIPAFLKVKDALEALDPESDLVKRFEKDEFVSGFGRKVRNALRRLEKKTGSSMRRLLRLEPTLEECLEGLERERLGAMADALEIEAPARRSPAPLRKLLRKALLDPAVIRRALDRLPAAATRALRELSEAGGLLPFAEFSRRHAAPSAEKAFSPQGDRPRTPLSFLEGLGLAHVGAVGATRGVVIPQELRPAIRAWAAYAVGGAPAADPAAQKSY